jgi:hypothetical protein
MHNIRCNMTKKSEEQKPQRITKEDIDACKMYTPPTKKLKTATSVSLPVVDLTFDDEFQNSATAEDEEALSTPTASTKPAARGRANKVPPPPMKASSSSSKATTSQASTSESYCYGKGGGFLLPEDDEANYSS